MSDKQTDNQPSLQPPRCRERIADNNDFINCDSPTVSGLLDRQRRPCCAEHAATERITVEFMAATLTRPCAVCGLYEGKVLKIMFGYRGVIRFCIECTSELTAKLAENGFKQLP